MSVQDGAFERNVFEVFNKDSCLSFDCGALFSFDGSYFESVQLVELDSRAGAFLLCESTNCTSTSTEL